MSIRTHDPAIGGYRLGVIGDIHGAHPVLKELLAHAAGRRLDALLLTGDFAPYEPGGSPSQYLDDHRERAVSAAETLQIPVLWVPGNHDHRAPAAPGNIDRRQVVVGADLKVYGIGGAGPMRFGFPYEWDEEEIEALPVPVVDVLLSHTPPRDTALDLLRSGGHVGSRAVRTLADRTRVLICGHIHEAAGVARVDAALAMNAGALGDLHAQKLFGEIELTDTETTVTLFDPERGDTQSMRLPRQGSEDDYDRA